ncbi:hypothetical protein [Flammeovirga sp. SJP92]|uniref:hypothetical protein n=1 Tax=Flammeovirga sp. SJP92 TaxID=1775430 RepID=UPI000786B5D6|nr:hypothetical protein [Flammeovirga sp. SJP92]KXX71029.1 hypothetical protein AVL50_10530 [Flammeovirga sp. SJP92]
MSIFTTRSKLSNKEIVYFISINEHLKKCVKLLYKDNYSAIEAMILQMQGEKRDAEDVFRYSLSKVIWLIQEKYIDDKADIKTYIYTLSRCLWVSTLKKKNNYTYYTSDSYHKNYDPQLLENLPFKEDDLFFHRQFSNAYSKCKPITFENLKSIDKLSRYWNTISSNLSKLSV